MATEILRLYPGPTQTCALRGIYLAHRLDQLGTPEHPIVYANFVSSLDGRIALRDPQGGSQIPKELTSGNDFRLFLELQAQADCIITHGGYMRAIAEGRLDDVLQVGTQAGSADLAQWRADHGLIPQPAVVIASASLDFVVPASIRAHGQDVYIATGAHADSARVKAFEQRGYEVLTAGQGRAVEGRALVQAMSSRGLKSFYLLAGPQMLATMLEDRMLSRLYLTLTHQVMGGEFFHTLASGRELKQAGRLTLRSLYHDPGSPGGTGQWFARFEA